MCLCSTKGKTTLGAIIFNATASQWEKLGNQAEGAGYDWFFITDRNLPNPYDVMPSYWTSEARFQA